jgi:putative acetyltransferase
MTATEMRAREVRPADVPQVIDLVRDVLAEFGLRFGEGSGTDEEVTRLPDSYVDQGGRFWVGVDANDLIVGTCGVFPVGEGTFELRKMYLRPHARGTGAGQLLFDTCLDFVRASGAKRLVLDTTHDMTRAIAFYERNGFVRDDAQIRGARCSRGYTRDLSR